MTGQHVILGHTAEPEPCGIRVRHHHSAPTQLSKSWVLSLLQATDLQEVVQAQLGQDASGSYLDLKLQVEQSVAWAPGFDTLSLCTKLKLDTLNRPEDLQREIILALLMSPILFEFPSMNELASAVRIRGNIVRAARKTMLAFHTEEALRPAQSWTYREGSGFILLPGASLINALIQATQPEPEGEMFAFSCYRATEYLILLGIAQELQTCNPALFDQLQNQWRKRAIMSGEFHDVFLREIGSMQTPIAPRFYVPGDRTWFRNPDAASADAAGFEGSWVLYLGDGLFANFWKRDQHYTLSYKCLEIFHWRDGLYLDAQGELSVNEPLVEQRVAETQKDPLEVERIFSLMNRYREPRGVYTEAGGCIDTTREMARWVCPETADLVLPLD
jgi:hypothetical protein